MNGVVLPSLEVGLTLGKVVSEGERFGFLAIVTDDKRLAFDPRFKNDDAFQADLRALLMRHGAMSIQFGENVFGGRVR